MQQSAKSKTCIVIVTFNGMQWIERCLTSAKAYQVVVVDNCSTDGTQQYIKKQHPEIVLLEQEDNLGFGKANNIGISFALKENSDYVFLLNQDAFLEPETIPKLLKSFSNNPDFGILSPVHLNGEGTKLESVFSYFLHKNDENGLLSDLLLDQQIKEVYPVPMVNAAAWLISRKTLQTVGGFQPLFFLYGEDDNYCQRVIYHGFRIGICPGSFVKHDSSNNYHLYPEKGTEKYYAKFMNRIKIDYANVNNNNFQRIKDLRKFYFKKAIASLIQRDLKTFKINLKKHDLLKGLDFKKEVKQDRLKAAHYLLNIEK